MNPYPSSRQTNWRQPSPTSHLLTQRRDPRASSLRLRRPTLKRPCLLYLDLSIATLPPPDDTVSDVALGEII